MLEIEFNRTIYLNIKNIMDNRKISTRSLAKDKNKNRATFYDKLSRLKNGNGISTTSLCEIAEMLEVSVEDLIK